MKNLIKKNQLMITALAVMIAIAGYLQFAGTGTEEDYLTVNDSIRYTDDSSEVDSDTVVSENYTADGLLDLSEEDMMSLTGQDSLGSNTTDIDSLDSDLESIYADDYLDSDLELSGISQADSSQAEAVSPEEGEVPGEAVFTSSDDVTVMLSEAKLLKEQTRARNRETLMEIINSDGLTDEQKQAAVDSMVKMTEIAEKEAAAEILLEAKGFTDVVVSINDGAADVVVDAENLDDVMRAQIEDIVKRKTEIPAENIIISTVSR